MPQKVCYNLLPTEQGQSARGLRSSHNCADINSVVALNLTLHLPGRTDMHYARIYNIVHICMCCLSLCVGVCVCLCSYLTRTRNTIKQHLNARLVFVQLDTTRHVACARNNWYFNGPTELSGCLLVCLSEAIDGSLCPGGCESFRLFATTMQQESVRLTFNVDVCILTLIAFIVSTRGCKKR